LKEGIIAHICDRSDNPGCMPCRLLQLYARNCN